MKFSVKLPYPIEPFYGRLVNIYWFDYCCYNVDDDEAEGKNSSSSKQEFQFDPVKLLLEAMIFPLLRLVLANEAEVDSNEVF